MIKLTNYLCQFTNFVTRLKGNNSVDVMIHRSIILRQAQDDKINLSHWVHRSVTKRNGEIMSSSNKLRMTLDKLGMTVAFVTLSLSKCDKRESERKSSFDKLRM